MLADLARTLAPHGLILRGGFHPGPGEDRLAAIGTVVMIGNAGAAMWEAFAPHVDGAPHPLDRWTRRVVDPIARAFDAAAAYPFGAEAPPFQRWALRAETLHASPIGILIHPEYGLWHAYRAALLFAGTLDLPPPAEGESPCDACAAKPCLSACPVGAFAGDAYDVAACAGRIAAADADCLAMGCHARSACPVGSAWRYPPEQVRFHMAAFRRSVVP